MSCCGPAAVSTADESKSGSLDNIPSNIATAVTAASAACPSKPAGKKFKYGTAGFRAKANVLDSTFLRVGMLSALRGKQQKGQVRAQDTHISKGDHETAHKHTCHIPSGSGWLAHSTDCCVCMHVMRRW